MNPSIDRRITDISDFLQAVDPNLQSAFEFAQDPFRTSALNLLRFMHDNPFQTGKVVLATPYVNWYKVQLDRVGVAIGCCMGMHGSSMPMGVFPTAPIPVNSMVLVYRPPGWEYGIIICVIPEEQVNGAITVSELISQDLTSGFRREKVHYEAMKLLEHGGSVRDFSGNKPLDATSFDWGYMAETGLGIHVDSFQAFLRVNEICGLFLNYFDSYMRLAGWNFDLQTAVHELNARDDQGESLFFQGVAVYPWEALGALSPGQTVFQERDDKSIQFDNPYAKLDLSDDSKKVQPFYRCQEYGGYLGQGRKRYVAVPAQLSGLNKYEKGLPPDIGVFEETVCLDGEYFVRSAKGIFLSKEILIPNPRRVNLPEDQAAGDGSDDAPYRFSGLTGEGDEHKIGNVIPAGPDLAMRSVAGVEEARAHANNWKGVHPFHYHKADFELPEERELPPQRAVAPLNFSALQGMTQMPDPEPVPLPIDHRYGQGEFYRTKSYFGLLPDGSVVIGDGYGAEIRLSGGNIDITCPGDVRLLPGRSIIGLAGDDCVLRAKQSVDITASEKDVRLKAERNFQVLAGNSGSGGILLESRASGESNSFAGVVGEDVQTSGIMLKSSKAPIVGYGASVYLRTGGGGGLSNGEIVLDASKGNNGVSFYGRDVSVFADALAHYIGAKNEEGEIQAAHLFTKTGAFIAGGCTIGGPAVITKNGITVEGNIAFTGAIGNLKGGQIGKFEGESLTKLKDGLERSRTGLNNLKTTGKATFEGTYKARYASSRVGNSDLISQAMTTLRNTLQYGTMEFKLAEARWQQIDRLGGQRIGTPWQEKPVQSGSEITYPYPGREAMENPTFYLLNEPKLHDFTNGRSQDRETADYENYKIEQLKPVPLNGSYTTIL